MVIPRLKEVAFIPGPRVRYFAKIKSAGIDYSIEVEC
jgi:hypothetical protein